MGLSDLITNRKLKVYFFLDELYFAQPDHSTSKYPVRMTNMMSGSTPPSTSPILVHYFHYTKLVFQSLVNASFTSCHDDRKALRDPRLRY